MSTYIGIFDIIVILVLIIFNIRFWKKEWGCLIQISGILSYILILPFLSMAVEIERVSCEVGIRDNFEILYTWFRFPLYWILFIIQVIANSFRP
jgi:hypothetical protein